MSTSGWVLTIIALFLVLAATTYVMRRARRTTTRSEELAPGVWLDRDVLVNTHTGETLDPDKYEEDDDELGPEPPLLDPGLPHPAKVSRDAFDKRLDAAAPTDFPELPTGPGQSPLPTPADKRRWSGSGIPGDGTDDPVDPKRPDVPLNPRKRDYGDDGL